MAELSLREQLQPALLDRLTDDERVITVFELRVDAAALKRMALPLRDLVAILTAQGLRSTADYDADTDRVVGDIHLQFTAGGRSVSLSQVRDLTLRPPGAPQGIRLQDFCSVQASTTLNTHTETLDRRVVSMRKLRESVLRDLGWLLNAMSYDTTEDLARYPQVVRSVLNYGMPNLAGRTLATLEPAQAAARIQRAIEAFEPRLSRVRVIAETNEYAVERFSLEFRVEAELWGQPVAQEMLMRTSIDVDTGAVKISESRSA
jgi:type VI secretion system protein ImpF